MSTPTVSTSSYPRPPILEAVIGITFAQPIKDSVVATADRRFAKHYPLHLDLNNVSLNVNLDALDGSNTVTAPTKHEVVRGHRRTNQSMDEIAVLLPDTLAVSQLAPYRGWEEFVVRFKRDLAMYKRPGAFREISRIGMRYINRIDIPISGNMVEHEQYLNLYPRVPDALGAIVGYTMRTTFTLENIGCQATLNTAPVASPTLGHASFLVDIDVYKSTNLPMNDQDVYSLLRQMRDEKNRIFEACVTERAREEIFRHANT